jgi:hypothetical protein
MHEVPSWMTLGGIAAAIVVAIVFTFMALKNKNMKVGFGKEGPFIETKPAEPLPQPPSTAPSAGDYNISGVDIKAHNVQGGIRIGHDNPGKK